eukprot:CAMPEP_0114054750 /NCGR_PEP_ID=MMETSP1339-20121228/87537_1 /TAXON_ID=94617 /ORGANISM="Fibrocapsa japonica" /LENGTH=39 /assembly_acc=CAM_ASM_000762
MATLHNANLLRVLPAPPGLKVQEVAEDSEAAYWLTAFTW